MGTIFDLRDVSYTYIGKINALKDISFKVDPGEQISIMGLTAAANRLCWPSWMGLYFLLWENSTRLIVRSAKRFSTQLKIMNSDPISGKE